MKHSLADAMRSRPASAVPGAGGPSEQRAFRRYGVNLVVLVQPVDAHAQARRGAMISAVVTDLSVSGLVFVSPRPHPPGSQVDVQISLGAHVFLVRAVVRRSQILTLPGRRTFQCAAQLARGEAAARFVPAVARYLLQRQRARNGSGECPSDTA
jgi:hypothetical protein